HWPGPGNGYSGLHGTGAGVELSRHGYSRGHLQPGLHALLLVDGPAAIPGKYAGGKTSPAPAGGGAERAKAPFGRAGRTGQGTGNHARQAARRSLPDTRRAGGSAGAYSCREAGLDGSLAWLSAESVGRPVVSGEAPAVAAAQRCAPAVWAR